MLKQFNSLLIIKGSNIMIRELLVKSKNVYGRELVYPICNDSLLICELLNVKTLNDYQMRKLKKLDYRFSFNQNEYDFNCQN
jgi:hypothetical protein|tara:strand:+ start:214 stop:459 length:246 start_codon:yes stop_codon:yes gene_type:complete